MEIKTFTRAQLRRFVDSADYAAMPVLPISRQRARSQRFSRHFNKAPVIEVSGQCVQREGRIQRDVRQIRSQIGFVFQQFNLVDRLPVMANVLVGRLHRMPLWRSLTRWFNAHERALAIEALGRVGIAECHAQRASTLSGGQQQRAAIARTLAMQPKVILFDEPTSALDPEMVQEVLNVIRALAEEGRTMLLVTHEMGFARQVSSEVVFLHQGLVEEQGSPQQVFENPLSARCKQFMSSNR